MSEDGGSEPLRVAAIGCGAISRSYLRAIDVLPEIKLVATVDTDPSRAQAQAAAHGAERWSVDVPGTLAAGDVDAALVFVPSGLHAEVGVQALRAGKHVLITKPMVNSVAEADAMIAAAQTAGRTLMVGQTRRFSAVYRRAKELVEAGRIGRPLQFLDWLLEPPRQPPSFKPWYASAAAAGGGLILSSVWGPHAIDAALWLFDTHAVVAYCAAQHNDPRFEGESAYLLTLRLANGGVASIVNSFDTTISLTSTVLLGSEGTLTMAEGQGLVLNGEAQALPTSQPGGGMAGVLREFRRAIVTGTEPQCSGAWIRRCVAAMDAAKRSIRSGLVEPV
ncbi:MAG: Gfo/Idh/MocA family oxidoreductase, partial [Chloroflexi bacterium]|nr:Gfo/Idh/MocA family oxidoreductase [Chloroflexota bacterium]